MRIVATALLASGIFCVPAVCNDVKSAVSAFGLAGTWSANCSKALSEPRATRITFAEAPDGGVVATMEDNNGEAVTTIVNEIFDSTNVDSDKIRLGFHPVKVTKSGGQTPSQHAYDNSHIVFQKVGAKIEVIRIQYEGLPEIQWAAFFEKCSS